MNESISRVTDSGFEQDVLQSPLPALVYFWAQWCKECQPMSQLVEVVAAEKRDRLKTVLLDVDSNPRMAALHCIAMVPTVILFISGKERQRIEGVSNRAHLVSTIDMHISDAEEEIVARS
ncbi:MAG: thioredoxin 1 [Blastocatellia bacterium]|nr:thioredoxin 1 [Blastocatellia bacterium]